MITTHRINSYLHDFSPLASVRRYIWNMLVNTISLFTKLFTSTIENPCLFLPLTKAFAATCSFSFTCRINLILDLAVSASSSSMTATAREFAWANKIRSEERRVGKECRCQWVREREDERVMR